MDNRFEIKRELNLTIFVDKQTGKVYTVSGVYTRDKDIYRDANGYQDFQSFNYKDYMLRPDDYPLEFIDWIIDKHIDHYKILKPDRLSKEQKLKIYKKLNFSERMEFIYFRYMDGLLTSDMLIEILDNVKRTNLFFLSAIDSKLYTQEIFNKIVRLNRDDGRFISFVPEKYLTYEFCKSLVMKDYKLIGRVPLKFQTFELQKIAVDYHYSYLCRIPHNALNDEIIRYALNINGDAISNIPKEMRSKEYCDIAFANNPRAFSSIPDQHKTYDMCITVLKLDPKLYRHVPARYITPEFLEQLEKLNIVLPRNSIFYITECLRAHEKEKEYEQIDDEAITNPEIYSQFSNITLDDLRVLFSTLALQYLEQNHIENLSQLFCLVTSKAFLRNTLNSSVGKEIMGTVTLLKAKYLNIDPSIDINSETNKVNEVLDTMGLSTRARNVVRRSYGNYSAKEFFTKSQTDEFEYEFAQKRNNGEKTQKEIMSKIKLVLDYYEKQKKQTPKDLQNKLQALMTEREQLDIQINAAKEILSKQSQKENEGEMKL